MGQTTLKQGKACLSIIISLCHSCIVSLSCLRLHLQPSGRVKFMEDTRELRCELSSVLDMRLLSISNGLSLCLFLLLLLLLFLFRRPSLYLGCSGVLPSASASSSPHGVPALLAAASSAALTAKENRILHIK